MFGMAPQSGMPAAYKNAPKTRAGPVNIVYKLARAVIFGYLLSIFRRDDGRLRIEYANQHINLYINPVLK